MLSQLGTDISSLFPFVPRLSYEFTHRLAFVARNSFDSQDRLAFLVSTGSLGHHLFEKRLLLIQKVNRSGDMTSREQLSIDRGRFRLLYESKELCGVQISLKI